MPADSVGNTLDTARTFTVTPISQVLTDQVSPLDRNDYYKITLGGHSSFQLALNGMKANANVQLIQDVNANGVVDRDEVIASSTRSGKKAESINTTLNEGAYYIRVYSKGKAKTKYNLTVSAIPVDNAGNTLDTACNIGEIVNHSDPISDRDWVGKSDPDDYYKFSLDRISNLNISLEGLSGDADLRLLNLQGDILASSANVGTRNESITRTLDAGTYYARVYSYNSNETFYNLYLQATLLNSTGVTPTSTELDNNSQQNPNSSTTPLTAVNNQATLRADTFTYLPDSTQIVFSGKGNIDFGNGGRDLLDLSAFSSAQVQELNFANFDFTKLNFANPNAITKNQGVRYDPNDPVNQPFARIFDAISFVDGKQILFEGIDTIKFADTIIDLSIIPNDPLFNQQWNLHVMSIQNAWRLTTGSDQVLVGIEDTGLGIDSNGSLHPDLRIPSYFDNNYFDEWSNFSHGTLVEGAIAATSNNGIGIAGINWNSPVMHIDVIGGNQGDYDLVGATQALINQANGKPLVINLSLSGGYSEALEQLIANNQNNVLFVMAAGNGNKNTVSSPANLASKYNNVIAVGASWGIQDADGNAKTPGDRISYENWWGSNYGDGLTLMAPSEYPSTNGNRNQSGKFDFDYRSNFNGTSASTPNITGVASLVWSVNTAMTATQIRSILAETAYDLGNAGYDTTYGYGLVNADAAIRRALAVDPNRNAA